MRIRIQKPGATWSDNESKNDNRTKNDSICLNLTSVYGTVYVITLNFYGEATLNKKMNGLLEFRVWIGFTLTLLNFFFLPKIYVSNKKLENFGRNETGPISSFGRKVLIYR